MGKWHKGKKVVDIKAFELLKKCEEVGKETRRQQHQCFKAMADMLKEANPVSEIIRQLLEQGESIDGIENYFEDVEETCKEVFLLIRSAIKKHKKETLNKG